MKNLKIVTYAVIPNEEVTKVKSLIQNEEKFDWNEMSEILQVEKVKTEDLQNYRNGWVKMISYEKHKPSNQKVETQIAYENLMWLVTGIIDHEIFSRKGKV